MAHKGDYSNKSLASFVSGDSGSVIASTRNLTWWDKQQQNVLEEKPKDLTYREIVMKHRMQRRTFRSMSMSHQGLLSKATSSKSFQRITPFGPKLRKFIRSTKNAACVWHETPRVYKMNPLDAYEKCQEEMRSAFIDSYNKKIKSENTNIENVFNRIISTDVDPLQILDTVKVSCTLLKEVPDITTKKLCRPRMAKGEVFARLIRGDIHALAKQQTSAFGTSLGKAKSKINKYDFKTKYVNFSHAHPELESFQSVFEGISELETTKKISRMVKETSSYRTTALFDEEG